MKNSIEIMLDILNHVQGELFNDAKVIDIQISSIYDEAYFTLKLRNEDTVKFCVEYTSHVEEQGDAKQ